VEALRYRGEDVGRQLSKKAVREARARELAQELLNSAALTEYFEEHEAEKVGGASGGSSVLCCSMCQLLLRVPGLVQVLLQWLAAGGWCP
jgi:hypothetical protein